MSKELKSEVSTKQLKKAKLLDSFRQAPTNRNKVMLTDLCAQEKSKIGELVRTLETRKLENIQLEKKVDEMERLQQKYLSKIQQMGRMIEENRYKQMKFMEEITLCKIKQQEREKYIKHLLNQKDQMETEIKKKKIVAFADQFALTDPIISLSYGCQASPKRRKQKQVYIQTQAQNTREARNYPNNSRSFEKIMRGKTMSYDMGNKNEDNWERNVFNRKSEAYPEIKINDESHKKQAYHEQYQYEDDFVKRSSEVNPQEEEDIVQDDDFNELAKKWLELKQKNMSKIKRSYEKSKEKINKSSNGKNFKDVSKSVIPREFDEKNFADQDFEKVNYSPHLGNIKIDDNQSFGPRANQGFSRVQEDHSGEMEQDFDEVELNKILKTKNFSASRLLNKNHRLNQEVEERKRKNDSIKFESNTKKSNMKLSSASNSRSNNIDFYQTNLLDVVSSINRQ